ncbi:MAG: hypothetical protein WCH04_21230 [Gammaproteobacteria bacterium]
MTNTRWFNTMRGLCALGIAIFLVVVCGSEPALAEDSSDTRLNESAKDVSNNFGDLLKGMGQELKNVIGSDHKSESTAAEQDKNKEAEHANDNSGNDVKSK